MRPFVLVVDDSLTIRMDLRQALARANFAVAACGTLTTARQVLKSRNCDLAVLDIQLPDGRGTDLLREMKEDPDLRHIPVIVLSSIASSVASEKGADGGADKYLDKPCDVSQLVKIAESLCSANLGGNRYLVVDDSPTFLSAVADQIRQYGNEVLVAASGEEALSILQDQDVDCVILDMMMPGMGGLETCRRLRQRDPAQNTTIVMLTASENPSGRSQRLAVGADAFLIKSQDLDRLCAQIQALLRRKQGASSAQSPPPAVEPAPTAEGEKISSEHLQQLLGLHVSIAQMVVRRACKLAGVEPTALTTTMLPRLLQPLRSLLAMFLTADQIEQRLAALRSSWGRDQKSSQVR
jgi:DNA-binding response OmpR family regulator